MKETLPRPHQCVSEMGLISSFPEHSSEPYAAQAIRVNRHLPETELPALYPPTHAPVLRKHCSPTLLLKPPALPVRGAIGASQLTSTHEHLRNARPVV